MTNEEKYYRIIKNMLDNHADITLSWNDEKEEYEVSTVFIDQGWWHLSMAANWTYAVLRYEEYDKKWIVVSPRDVDKLIDGLRDSYFDYLLEGIE